MKQQTNTPTEATLAFVFSHDLQKVLLIEKQKPPQHAGLLNGLGGKLELNETHRECVVREVEEEAGITIPEKDWISIGTMKWTSWNVSIWTSRLIKDIQTDLPDKVSWYHASSLPSKVIENLQWLIPLCRDVHCKVEKGETTFPVINVVYQEHIA